jgi:acyl-coenzyme A thioesterase PaaI-like protein
MTTGAPPHTSEGMFLQDIGYTQEISDGVSRGWLQVTDELRAPGSSQVRASVLATMADVWTGALAGMACAPKLALTLDLTARIVGDVGGDRLDIVGTLLKQGRTTIVAETEFRHPVTGAVVALSHATFVASPRPQDVIGPLSSSRTTGNALSSPIAEALGAEVLSPGVVVIERGTYVNQPAGTLQGGVVAVLAELAAETLTGARVLELEVRYLSAVRVGPARTSAVALDDHTVRVEARDVGNHDRVTAVVMARLDR